MLKKILFTILAIIAIIILVGLNIYFFKLLLIEVAKYEKELMILMSRPFVPTYMLL